MTTAIASKFHPCIQLQPLPPGLHLNEHRLTGDIQWPASTPFEMAIGPLAGSFPILSLRTNKADVVVGVDQDVADKLDEVDNRKWRYDGRYISSPPLTS